MAIEYSEYSDVSSSELPNVPLTYFMGDMFFEDYNPAQPNTIAVDFLRSPTPNGFTGYERLELEVSPDGPSSGFEKVGDYSILQIGGQVYLEEPIYVNKAPGHTYYFRARIMREIP